MALETAANRKETEQIISFIHEQKNKKTAPFCAYLHHMPGLRASTQQRVQSLPDFARLFYAVKANSESAILQALAPIVHGFEAASLGEIEKIRQAAPNSKILFGGPGKTEEELEGALRHHVHLIHVESVHELNKLHDIAKRHGQLASVLLRINLRGPLPAATLAMGGRPTQFGIDETQIDQVMQHVKELSFLRVEGFHFHSLSNNLDAREHIKLVQYYIRLAGEWADKYDVKLNYLNAGGGLGVNYADLDKQFNWDEFINGLEHEVRSGIRPGTTLLFECGRYITAAAGYYATEVMDIKQNHGKHYVIVRGGTHQFRLPSSWQHSHPFEVIAVEEWDYPYARPVIEAGNVTVVGQLCTPKDVLAQDVAIKQVRAGDILLFRYAGAYGWAISHHDFLSHPHPAHYYLEPATVSVP
ncbi:type III PLP-dependent enzyme [Paenibacillus sp. GCM10012307]|uniref:Type III PLP-dependent enzyme n=1 Tax=Paenibacillus roseus TaxID=2798579 RepID=A0A934MQA8_9BACL|nr:type III PLP-dependent enzyme [Paenibacillus roseus]MBJ6362966.1 type III PLP-dependent enzyme [Paenibacillus roseus]